MFELDPRLAAGSLPVAELALCDLRLINDRRFRWLILVPRRDGLRELHQLSREEQQQLLDESGRVARTVESLFAPEKLNIGALGNVVPQFHWHLVARSSGDPCWPGPVWGCGESELYEPGEADALIATIAVSLEV